MELLNDIKIALLPESIMVLFIILTAVLSFASGKDRQDAIFYVSLTGVTLALLSMSVMDFSGEKEVLYKSFTSNYFTLVYRVIILAGTIFTLFLTKDYVKGFGKNKGEFYFLLMTASLGAMLLCGANDLIMVFVALETLSISSFALCGYTKSDRLSNEAALKYLVFGAAASAAMLYGFSFIYGITARTNLQEISGFLSTYEVNSILIIAFLLVLAGFGFKIAAVPFQSWAPDVYEGAPIPVAAYLSVVSKTAGFAVLIRFMTVLFPGVAIFSIILATFAVITMTAGNLTALGQRNIRRLMAYSSIAHAGYILLGLAILTNDGITAMTFYLITYLFMNFGVWAAIEILALATGKDNIDDFSGLGKKYGYFSLGLTLCLLSLAGIPVTAGFFSKFYLFKAVAVAGYEFMPVLVITLVNTVIALFYYMRIIRVIYLKPEPEIRHERVFRIALPVKFVMAICVAGVLLLGIFASPVIEKSGVINTTSQGIAVNQPPVSSQPPLLTSSPCLLTSPPLLASPNDGCGY